MADFVFRWSHTTHHHRSDFLFIQATEYGSATRFSAWTNLVFPLRAAYRRDHQETWINISSLCCWPPDPHHIRSQHRLPFRCHTTSRGMHRGNKNMDDSQLSESPSSCRLYPGLLCICWRDSPSVLVRLESLLWKMWGIWVLIWTVIWTCPIM